MDKTDTPCGEPDGKDLITELKDRIAELERDLAEERRLRQRAEAESDLSEAARELLALRDLHQWCAEHQATVHHFTVHGKARVKLRIGGHPPVERYTLGECVEAMQARLRSAQAKQ